MALILGLFVCKPDYDKSTWTKLFTKEKILKKKVKLNPACWGFSENWSFSVEVTHGLIESVLTVKVGDCFIL